MPSSGFPYQGEMKFGINYEFHFTLMLFRDCDLKKALLLTT
ncbi:hypothetical protein HMPREF0322_02816 [Desulfitobacterium hafniense DP7]|uniref:Uncharacterized protein n=1 Tax=Desulfitobacterium hafniense DP7 TaxID=537010 RepID=G9XPB8_DESHA|nr:hypothetical protein HMPREF0322_02816 [Desulfitobacterium hafniense DP7]